MEEGKAPVEAAGSLFSGPGKSPKKLQVTVQKSRLSLFGSLAPSIIMEGRKSCLGGQKKVEDLISTFADAFSMWKEIIAKLTKGKQTEKALKETLSHEVPKGEFAVCYDSICELFATIVAKLENFNFTGASEYLQKAFSDELIQVAGLAISHTNGRILDSLALSLDSAETLLDHVVLEKLFAKLRTFHEFFFALAKLRCNPVLSDRQLVILQETCKTTLTGLQLKVQNNLKLLFETPIQAQKLRAIATQIYYLMQTVAILSIFGELESQTAAKYQNILERFKTIFALISQSAVFDKVFGEPYDFESVWGVHDCKYVLSSFGQKRLTIFLQKHKLAEEEGIFFSLKYLVVYYNYKVLKLISQRLHVSYDEHILSIFSVLIHKNRSLLSTISSTQKDKQNSMRIMLLLNENVYILKSYIVNLAYFSDNLDPMQRQAKYDTIKDTAIDCFTLSIKSGMCCHPDSSEEVNQLSIFEAKDFVGFVFKALLLYKTVKTKNASTKFGHEMIRHVNILGTDLASRSIPTDDTVCFCTYRLYFLQFLAQWDVESLKDKYVKYSEEMSRYLAELDEEEGERADSEVIKRLKARSQELALELYVKLAQLDCEPSVQATIGFIRESFTNERKLYKYFYIMFCLLCQKKVSPEAFARIMQEEPLKELLSDCLRGHKEIETFLKKEGMGVVFLIYKNATASYIQTKEQRHAYELELNGAFPRKSIATADVNTYVAQTYLKKLDATVSAYETLLHDTEAFVCVLHHSWAVAEHFLRSPEFDGEFYTQVAGLSCGRSLVLKLMKILAGHLVTDLGKPDLVEKFVAIITDLFQYLMSAQLKFEDEKPFTLSLIEIVESLLTSGSGEMCREVREILFHRAILVLFLETCQKPEYGSDIETFLRFLGFAKLVVKGNRLFYESPESKAQVYSFVLSQFDKFAAHKLITLPVVTALLQSLIGIGLETDSLDLAHPAHGLIKEPSAIETYFKILVKCFKSAFGREGASAEIKAYVLAPLEAMSNSLMNDCVLSGIPLQELLMKILKRADERDFRWQVSGHIGRISSTNTSAKHIQILMRHFLKSTKHIPAELQEDYYLALLDTLIDSISGESVRSMYFFSGQEKAFIRLKSPLPTFGRGVCWTGSIRLEKRSSPGQQQCIFSFLKVKPNEVKGIELYVKERKLVYRLVRLKKGDFSTAVVLPGLEIRDDSWHHITMAHIDREVSVYLDETLASCTLDSGAHQAFAKHKYNYSTVGAALDPGTSKYHSFFFGEMSALHFFVPSSKFKEAFKDLAHRGQHLASLYKHEASALGSHQDPGPLKGLKYADKEFIATTHFILDPKCNILNKLKSEDTLALKGRSLNQLDSLQETQVFFNRPAKDVFYNLGGFKTALPLLASKLQFTQDSVEHDSRVCSAILKLLLTLCLNGEMDVLNFLIAEHGIDILKHLFEKVGVHGKFTGEFVALLFKILELPAAKLLNKIVPALIEKLVFNIKIWSNSDFPVQNNLMKRIQEFLAQKSKLQFSPGEPYKCMLRMLYDYFALEEVDDVELKKFLENIRWDLTQIIMKYFQDCGTEDTVPTLVEFLLPRPDLFYSIRDLLYILMQYQSQRKASSALVNYLTSLSKSRRAGFDLVAALHMLINSSIIQKATLQKPSSIEDPAFVRRKITCCDHITSYSTHILLSLGWNVILASDATPDFVAFITGAVSSSSSQKGHSPVISELNATFVKGESFLSYLNPSINKGKLSSSEEIILHFLFHRPIPDSKKEAYEKAYLGEKTYLALLAHITAEPASFYLAEKDLVPRVIKSREFGPRARLVYSKVLENLRAFEPAVQLRIVNDTCRFLDSSKAFMAAFLNMDNVFYSVSGYLCKPKLLAEPEMKASLERFYLTYMLHYWKLKRGKSTFRDMWGFTVPEFLLIGNRLVGIILGDMISGAATANEDSLCSLMQFLYFLEDTALRIPHIMTQSEYVELVGKVLLCLHESKTLLYFWLPSFVPGHLPVLKYAPTGNVEDSQREGGLVRTTLKLLFGILVRSGKKPEVEKLALKLLSFYVFRKPKTQKKIETILGIKRPESSSAAKASDNDNKNPPGFLDPKISATFQAKLVKALMHDRSVAHQKTVEDVMKSVKKDPFESACYRGLLLIVELSQVLIYALTGTSSYREALTLHKPPTHTLESGYRVSYLSKMLARVVQACLAGGEVPFQKAMDEVCRNVVRMPDYQLEECFSNFDSFVTKEVIESSRTSVSEHGSPTQKLKSSVLEGESECSQRLRKFQGECVTSFVQINAKFAAFMAKTLDGATFCTGVSDILTAEHFLKDLLPGLHKLVTEDFLLIEKMILAQAESRPKTAKRLASPKVQTKEDKKRILRMRKVLYECGQKLSKQGTPDSCLALLDTNELNENPEDESNRHEKVYEELRKSVTSERAFAVVDRENERIFDIVGKYYAKILARCPLHRSLAGTQTVPASGFRTFIKLDPARDNLGRALRLKKIRHPLGNASVLRGISYVRHFFLKRLLVQYVAYDQEEGVENVQMGGGFNNFLIPSQDQHKLLKALTERAKPRQRLSALMRQVQEPREMPSTPVRSTAAMVESGGHMIKPCVSRSQLAHECKVKVKKELPRLETEIIKYDHSVFGVMKFSEEEIVFSSKEKSLDKPEYRLGSTRLMAENPGRKMRKTWRYTDIVRVIARKYNMIRQAVEIELSSRRSVFLVLFSESHLNEFFSVLEPKLFNTKKQTMGKNAPAIIIKDSKKEFAARKFTEEWRKRRMSNFEYLITLNDYSSRSFQSLAQYPVFPWTLLDFASKDIVLSSAEYRDLKYPIAGISEKKREEATKKYENTDDFPGGRFQFGSHYLPGRAVLGYLMRLQPYTLMIYRFDSGGDCPSRHFHQLHNMWANISVQCDNNLELIPEFYYNPEFLANHNNYSFGMKLVEDLEEPLYGQLVRVDSVVLPQWAENRHHFILMNYLALEHPRARSRINAWIDLIFGEKQQKHEAFNLFKPLTSEAFKGVQQKNPQKTVKTREESKERLEPSDISQIAEFGHHPTQLFDKQHAAFEDKTYEGTRLVLDVFSEHQRYAAGMCKLKEGEPGLGSCMIHVMVKDRSNIVILNSNNELSRKQLISGKNEYKSVGPSSPVSRYLSIYNPSKETFTVDPQSVFTFNEDYLVTCRDTENDFTIYGFQSLAYALSVDFHKTIVNTVHLNEHDGSLYTGDLDGVVAAWKIADILQGCHRPKHFMADHNDPVASLDANTELDLYASASRTCCVLRVASNDGYFLTIVPELAGKVRYSIFKVLLSARGYVIIHARSVYKTYERDMLMVYSVNGEKIVQKELDEFVNAILMDPHHYFIITGGNGKKLRRYCIVTLKEEDLGTSIEGGATFPATITSLAYVPGEKTTVLVGLANSQLYLVDFYIKFNIHIDGKP